MNRKPSTFKLVALAASLGVTLWLAGCDDVAPPSRATDTAAVTSVTQSEAAVASETSSESSMTSETETEDSAVSSDLSAATSSDTVETSEGSTTTMTSETETITEAPVSTVDAATDTEATVSESTSDTPFNPDTGLDLRVSPREVPADAWTEQPHGNWSSWPPVSSLPIAVEGNYEIFREQADSDQPLRGAVILLDAGHGGWDPGALREDLDPIVREKDINLDVALEARDILESLGATVLLTRDDDQGSLLYHRVGRIGLRSLDELQMIAAQQGAANELDLRWIDDIRPGLQQMLDIHSDRFDEDLSLSGRSIAQGIGMNPEMRMLLDLQGQLRHMTTVSIHVNSVGEPTRYNQGLLVYYYNNEQMLSSEQSTLDRHNAGESVGATPISPAYSNYASARSKALATSIFKGFANEVPEMLNQAYIERDGHYLADVRTSNLGLTRESNLTTILIEMGFITDENDFDVMNSTEGRSRIAAGIADGIREYYAEHVWRD